MAHGKHGKLAAGGGPNLFEREDAAICDRRPTAGKSFDNTRAFLSELTARVRVLAEGEVVDTKDYFPPVKESGRLAKKRYYRRLEIVSRYASEYTESADKVAKKFGRTSRERVRQIFKKTFDDFWKSAPDELKQKYPFESLDTDKQNSIHYGLRGEVVAMLESGEDVKAFKKRLGVDTVSYVRKTLRRFGVEVLHARQTIPERFAGLKNPDATRQQTQELLDEVKHNEQRRVLLKAGWIINLSQVARRASLYPNATDILSIYNKLRAEELPVRRLAHKIKGKDGRETLRYYNFIAAKDLARATDILSTASEFARLKQNPVVQVSGPDGKIPNTNDLRFSKNYGHVGNLIFEISGKRLSGNSKIKLADIIKNLPGPTYKMLRGNGGFYYPVSQKEEFREYLTLRLREFGLI